MNYLFTSESVSEGHPDKVADQISDAIVDKLLAYDAESKVACETLVTTGQVVIAGEVKSEAYIDLMETARRVINEIGYNKGDYKWRIVWCAKCYPRAKRRHQSRRGACKCRRPRSRRPGHDVWLRLQ